MGIDCIFESFEYNDIENTLYADAATGEIRFFKENDVLIEYLMSDSLNNDAFIIPSNYKIMDAAEYKETGMYYEQIEEKGKAFNTKVNMCLMVENTHLDLLFNNKVKVYFDDKYIGAVKGLDLATFEISTTPGEHILKFAYTDHSVLVGIFMDERDSSFSFEVEIDDDNIYAYIDEFWGASAYYKTGEEVDRYYYIDHSVQYDILNGVVY